MPVSSSAQLVLLPWLLGWPPARDRTTFAAGLHAGSCLGISWALRRQLLALDRRTVLLLAGASVPAAVAGALAADAVEERLGRPPQLAVLLAGAGLVMWTVDARAERLWRRRGVRRAGRQTGGPVAAAVPPDRSGGGAAQQHGRPVAAAVPADRQAPTAAPARRVAGLSASRDSRREARTPWWLRAGRTARTDVGRRRPPGAPTTVGPREAAWAGAAQVVALVPGVSRSGATLTALRAAGVPRAEAERFSLLMSLPVTAGAAALTLVRTDRAELPRRARELAPGALTAALAGAVAARRRVARPGTPVRGAALYRLGLATAVVLRLRSRKDGP